MNKTYELSYTAEHIDELLGKVDEGTVYQDASTEKHGLMSATDKTKLDALPTAQQIDGALDAKVDKVEGKGLSTNDYTDNDKSKLAAAYQKPQSGIPASDLSSQVQTSLGKADTALQSYTETDPTVPSWAKQQNKPSYTASEVGAIPSTDKGANGGVATLDSSGKVPQSQLPSYVDDVLEYANLAAFPATGETGKIYVALDTNKTYRWGGSSYVEISSSLALGETSSTAFAGNRGKAIEDRIPSNASSSNKLATMDDLPEVTTDYDDFTNKPQINSVELSGNKSASDFGLATAAQGAKADTAVQQVTVGTTTTGAAGTNASVTNSGTSTAPVLDFTIPRGADAVNPFKGWYETLAKLKAAHTATEGDTAYVKDASPATTWSIYVYDSTASSDNYWADSGTDADTSNVQTFASSEEVNETHIDNTHLVNPADGALPTANDALQLKAKLEGVTAEEIKVTPIEDWHPEGSSSGYYNNGSWANNSNFKSTRIDVSGYESIRFLGYNHHFNSFTPQYVFFDDNNTSIGSYHEYYDSTIEDGKDIELNLLIPDGAKYLVCLYKAYYSTGSTTYLTESKFYAYLQAGDTVVGLIDKSKVQVVDNLDTDDATKALSAKQGKELKDSIFGQTEYVYGDNIPITSKSNWQMYLPVTDLNNNAVKKNTGKSKYLLNSLLNFAGKRILVKGNDTSSSYIMFVKNSFGTTTGGTSRTLQWLIENDYLTDLHRTSNGWISAIEVQAGETKYFDLPENIKSIMFASSLVSGTCEIPSEFKIGKTVTQGGELTEIKKSINDIASQGESQLMFKKGKVNNSHKIVDSDKNLISSLISLNDGYHIRIDDEWKIDNIHYYGANGKYLGYHKEKYMTNSNYYLSEFGDASYIPDVLVRIEVSRKDNGDVTGEENIINSFVVLSDRRLSKIAAVSPDNYAEYLRRIKQITNIKWVALEKIPALNSENSWNYLKGLTYIGLPYSEACEYSKYVRGTTDGNVSFITYITALLNKHSVIYTEDIENGHSASAYGITYHGYSDHSAPFYGCVCADLTRYSSGVANPNNQGSSVQDTWSILAKGYKSGSDLVWKVGNETMNIDNFIAQIQPMDYIIDADHYSTISEIFTNEYGDKLFVWSEQNSWNGNAINKVYDIEGLKQRLVWSASKGASSNPCCLFRRSAESWFDDEIENTTFISTKWYDYPKEIVVDQDIMPYLGDYCAFVNNVTTNNDDSVWTAVDKYSDIPVNGAMNNFLALVYAHRGVGYDKIRIWSDVNGDDTDSYNDYSLADGNDWIAQSELYNEDSSSEEDWVVIDLKAFTSNQLIAGKYRAQLIDSNSDKESGFVHFEMVDIEFSVTRPTSSTVHCEFGCSDNATPYRIRREDISGLPRTYVINLSDEQKESGQYDGDFGFSDNSMFIKLYCDCEYGTVVMRIKGYDITPLS